MIIDREGNSMYDHVFYLSRLFKILKILRILRI